MVGNLCSAVPCCDSGPILQVYDAAMLVAGPTGKRKVPLGEWFVGPRMTVLKRGEIATGVAVPLPKKKHGACFVKLRRYEGEDLAQASVTVLVLRRQQVPDLLRLRRAPAHSWGKSRSPAGRPRLVGKFASGSGAARATGNRAHHRHSSDQEIPDAHGGRDAGTRTAGRSRKAGRHRTRLRHEFDLGGGHEETHHLETQQRDPQP